MALARLMTCPALSYSSDALYTALMASRHVTALPGCRARSYKETDATSEDSA